MEACFAKCEVMKECVNQVLSDGICGLKVKLLNPATEKPVVNTYADCTETSRNGGEEGARQTETNRLVLMMQ